MNAKNLHCMYFSPNKTTQKIIRAVAEGIELPNQEYNFTHVNTFPATPPFSADDLVIFGLPVYAGRVPEPATNYLRTVYGQGTPCIIIGVYGNRAFDDFLVELEDIAKEQGFLPIAAAAFIGEHCITNKLGTGRPDENDLALARTFGRNAVNKLVAMSEVEAMLQGIIPGNRPYRTYAASKSGKLNPVKVANGPTVNDSCTNCKLCVAACPIDLIKTENIRDIDPFECLRCHACVHVCPVGAISFLKPQFIRHIKDLEARFTRPQVPTIIM